MKRLTLILTILSFFSTSVFAQVHTADDIRQLCLSAYEKQGTCPAETCRFVCVEGTFKDGCLLACEPKDCLQLSVENCPLDSCQIMDGCVEKEKVCYPKIEDPSECGELAYVGGKDCCEGFVKRCGIEFFDGTCDMVGTNTASSTPICLPCGNGICNQFENRCNCPEDCST